MIEVVGFAFDVPGNVSRYFSSQEEARSQPLGRVDLVWDSTDPLIFNHAFDPGIVRHDTEYCTSSVSLTGEDRLPTLEYFEAKVAPHLSMDAWILDIGCGQGEFVHWLRSRGWNAIGFDPVVREPSPILQQSYWTSSESSADLFVMRCVLPHISQPWEFLKDIAASSDDALVLIEYQRLEFILEHELWFQISHDHVNQFQLSDFQDRYEVVDHGVFSSGEWEWVLLRPGAVREPPVRTFALQESFDRLAAARHDFLRGLTDVNCPLAIWGAAGKGVVIAHALDAAGADPLVMIDADPAKAGLYVEATGFLVISPQQAIRELRSSTKVLVSNPNHVAEVRQHVGGAFDVCAAAHWRQ